MTTRDKLLICLCGAGLVVFGLYESSPPVEAFLAEHGWSQATGAAEAVVVEDTSHRTPEIGAVVVSPLVRDAAAKKAIAFHVADPASQGPDIAEVQWAIDAAKGKTLPVICYRHGTGRATVKPLPATPQAAVQLLQAI